MERIQISTQIVNPDDMVVEARIRMPLSDWKQLERTLRTGDERMAAAPRVIDDLIRALAHSAEQSVDTVVDSDSF